MDPAVANAGILRPAFRFREGAAVLSYFSAAVPGVDVRSIGSARPGVLALMAVADRWNDQRQAAVAGQ
jgi:hypothetical protein